MTTKPRRKYKSRRIELADGEGLLLRPDGTIEHRDRAGDPIRTWAPDDPDWARPAIRFGLHAEPTTIAPSPRSVFVEKPPI
ncbi:MAG TPA: hypothetical protein VGM28_05315 [Candidatus Limnocylindrales bacterium]|jgi:hypothetical protein